MKCEEIQAILADYEVGGLEPPQRAAVEAHLARCDACQAELRLLAGIGALLAQAPAYEPPADLWHRVERKIAAPEPVGWSRRLSDFLAPPLRRVAIGAAVAAAAATVGLVLWLGPLRPPPGPRPAAPNQEGEIYAGYQAAASWDSAFADRVALGVLLADMPNSVQEEAK